MLREKLRNKREQASPNGATPSQKTKPTIVVKHTGTFTWGLPHELKLFTFTKLLLFYKLLDRLGAICCRCNRRRRRLLTPRRHDIQLDRSQGDIHLRPRLRAIHKLGSVLPMHASSHIFTTDVHHPLSRDLLRHRPCVRQQALPDRLDVLHAQALSIPTADSSEV